MSSKQKIIFYTQPKLLFLFTRYQILSRRSLISGAFKDYTILREDLFSATDYRYADHLASCLDEKIMSKLFNHKGISFLADWGGTEYSKHFISLALNKEVKKILVCVEYIKKVCESEKIEGNIVIWPGNFSYRLYKTLRDLGEIPENIKLHPWAKIYLKLYSLLFTTYFFFKSLIYIEKITLRASKSEDQKNYSVDSILHLDDGLFDTVQTFENNKIFRMFSNPPLLINEEDRKQDWEDRASENGYLYLRLDNIVRTISKTDYLKTFFKTHFKFRSELLLLLIRNPEIAQACYEALRLRVLWDLFYKSHTTKNVLRTMIAENLTSSIVHKKNGVKTTFVYFSSTEPVVTQRVKQEKSICHEYSHMISDYVVSSKVSNSFIKSLECSVGQYIDIGPIFREISKEVNANKKDYFSKLKIPKESKVISFLDHTIGHIGVVNTNAYRKFLHAILDLADKNQDVYFLFKTKKDIRNLNRLAGFNVAEIINQIQSKVNCLYANDYNLTSLEIIGIADLVVSAPMSSVIYESLSAGVRTISFDPEAQYRDFSVPSQKIPYLSAYSLDELEKLINRWLFETNDAQFQEFLNEHLLPYIEINQDESSIEQFQLFLKECQLNEA